MCVDVCVGMCTSVCIGARRGMDVGTCTRNVGSCSIHTVPAACLQDAFTSQEAPAWGCTCGMQVLCEGLAGACHVAMPRHATPRQTAPHHTGAAPCATLHYSSMPHRSKPHHTTPHHTAPHHTMPSHATPHHTTPRHATPHTGGRAQWGLVA